MDKILASQNFTFPCNIETNETSSIIISLETFGKLNIYAYLGPRGITLRAVAQFLGGWEARKKRGGFLILSCIHYYIEIFQELNLGKVLFLLQPPKIYCPCFMESKKKSKTLLVCFLFG